jgi:hypothetical protein
MSKRATDHMEDTAAECRDTGDREEDAVKKVMDEHGVDKEIAKSVVRKVYDDQYGNRWPSKYAVKKEADLPSGMHEVPSDAPIKDDDLSFGMGVNLVDGAVEALRRSNGDRLEAHQLLFGSWPNATEEQIDRALDVAEQRKFGASRKKTTNSELGYGIKIGDIVTIANKVLGYATAAEAGVGTVKKVEGN